MIERMARAIHAADDENFRYDFDLSMYEPQARAALTALLEPTEAMEKAGARLVNDHGRMYSEEDLREDARDILRASIQAALDEKEGV